jgi:hypothetical protein
VYCIPQWRGGNEDHGGSKSKDDLNYCYGCSSSPTPKSETLQDLISYRLLSHSLLIFASSSLSGGCFWQASLLCGCDAVVPIVVKRTFGWNSFGADLISLAVVVPSFISPGIGYLSDKYGLKWLSVFDYLACAPPLILLRLVDP